jgi:chromosome segregation ATPase
MSTPGFSVDGDRDIESSTPPRPPKHAGGTLGRTASKQRSEIPIRKSLGPSSFGSPGPQKLKMQNAQNLRESLQSEKREITPAELGLQQEIDKIGEELNLTMKGSSRGVKGLSSRLEQLEARVPHVDELNSKYEALKRTSEAALAKKDRQLEAMKKDLNDCLNENDVMFEKLNEELVKISNGLRAGRGEIEMSKLLQEAKCDQARLRRENMLVLHEPPHLSFIH